MTSPRTRRALSLLAALAFAGSLSTRALADDATPPRGGDAAPAGPGGPSSGPGPAPAPAPGTGAPAGATGGGALPRVEPSGPDAATREGVLKAIDSLRDEVAEIRGLAWKTRVEADLLTREQFRARLAEMIKEDLDPKDYDRAVKLLRRTGLLAEDEDPLEIEKGFLGEGVAGFYDPKTKKLYVIDGLSIDAQRPTIFHELVHALEDQYIDLEKRQKALEKDGDRSFAFKCCVEGSAEHARAIYEKRHPDVAKLARREQMKDVQRTQSVVAKAPGILVLPTLLHYQTGPALVARIVHDDYAKGMERCYADAPCSEEQVMHPGKYCGEDRDLPRTMAWPKDLAASVGAGWTSLDVDPLGELDVALWLDRWLGSSDGHLDVKLAQTGRLWTKAAGTAAEGWDGAWIQLLLDPHGEARAYAFASAWDSPKDAREAADAFALALAKQYRSSAAKGKGGDGWVAKDWVEGGATRTLDFTDPYGSGRIVLEGDELFIVDGVPASALDTTFSTLTSTPIARDPKDTWKPDTRDPLADATWRHAPSGFGWKAPGKDWSVAFTKGDLSIRVETLDGPIQSAVFRAFGGLKKQHPDFQFDVSRLEETKIGGKDAARYEFTTGAADAKTHVVVFFVPLGDTILVGEGKAPESSWSTASKDLDDALAGFVSRDTED